MSIFKKVIATLTAWRGGRENIPDRTPGISRAQEELKQEQNLAREREAMRRERMRQETRREQGPTSEGVEEETIEVPEDNGRAA